MVVLNLILACGLVLFLTGAILILQFCIVVQGCVDFCRQNSTDLEEPQEMFRFYQCLPPVLRAEIEHRLNLLPEAQRIDAATAIAEEWDTEELACVVIQTTTGDVALEFIDIQDF